MSDTQPKLPEKSLGELFGTLSSDFSQLVHDEMDLAKLEMKEEAKKAAKTGGMLGAAAFAGYMAILLLSFAAAWALKVVMPEGVAFLIVALIWAAVAAVLGLRGKKEMKKIDPVPQQTVETMQEDVQWAKDLKS